MERTKWAERIFTFNIPPGWLPNILERLAGTALRLRTVASTVTDEKLSFQIQTAWSIKQHIGHLHDLEELHDGRIDDFLARKMVLRAADMSNEKTQKAGHNSKNLTELMKDFEISRNHLISRLATLDDTTQMFQSLHPRLKETMRPVDMAFFIAEHDDFHLALILRIINQSV